MPEFHQAGDGYQTLACGPKGQYFIANILLEIIGNILENP
jgi:hypothetical protein